MATLLLELFSEEIPSRMQRGAMEQLERLMLAGFEKSMLKPTEVKTFVSPRHLAIQCFGLPTIQPDMREEKRGPKIGAPEQAMKGFLQSSGLTLEQCEQRDGYYYATIERKGRAVADVVKEMCESTLTAFGWPKSMRWGSRPLNWVRPLHRIACLLDDAVVPVAFAHLTASNLTQGHRFMAPEPITITHAEKYEALLRDAKVMVDYAARRTQIKSEIAALAAAANLRVSEDEALLDEVTGLVEWPVPLLCQFDKKFLDLPPEVLISEMKNHQRYFALKSADGKLSDQFITVANMVTADSGTKVKEGNARVVRARLADGEFYWEQDRKVSLEDWGKKLSDVVFHAQVGMMNEKVERIEALAVAIVKALCHAERSEESKSNAILRLAQDDYASVRRAAQLCKADLTSGMVGEFPELQGIMGRYYATAQGESQDIADAIRDHYKPLGASDSAPESALAAILAIADKLDSITSLFAAGEKPTGSKDPLALRRAALGVLRIILQHGWLLNLLQLIKSGLIFSLIHINVASQSEVKKSIDVYDGKNTAVLRLRKLAEEALVLGAKASQIQPLDESDLVIVKDICDFFRDRLSTTLREEGIRHDAIDALAHTEGFNALAIANNARTLATWLVTDAGKTTLAAIKRSMNILAAEEKKSKTSFTASFSDTLTSSAEKALIAALKELDSRWNLPHATSRSGNEKGGNEKVGNERGGNERGGNERGGNERDGNDKKPEMLEVLTAPIDLLFNREKGVQVTEVGFREARLSLLAAVRDAANAIADFSKIEG